MQPWEWAPRHSAPAARTPARRTWWLAVSLVAALIATGKAGGTVHVEGMEVLRDGLGEAGAIAAVAFLMGVLVGVAPRLVLPAGWALRRAADVETVPVREAVPGRPAIGDSFRG